MCVLIKIQPVWLVCYTEQKLRAFIKLKVAEYKTATLSRLLSFVIDL